MNGGRRDSTCFWRDRHGHEADFLLDRGAARFALEAKAGRTITNDWFKGLSYYGDLDELCPPENRYLVYGGDEDQKTSACHVVSWKDLPAAGQLFAESGSASGGAAGLQDYL